MIIYYSVFMIFKSTTLSCKAHFEKEKDNKYVMRHRTIHNRLFLLKRQRDEIHSEPKEITLQNGKI